MSSHVLGCYHMYIVLTKFLEKLMQSWKGGRSSVFYGTRYMVKQFILLYRQIRTLHSVTSHHSERSQQHTTTHHWTDTHKATQHYTAPETQNSRRQHSNSQHSTTLRLTRCATAELSIPDTQLRRTSQKRKHLTNTNSATKTSPPPPQSHGEEHCKC